MVLTRDASTMYFGEFNGGVAIRRVLSNVVSMILEYATTAGPRNYNTLSLPSDDTHAAEYLYAAVQDAGYDSVDQVLVTDGEAGRSNSVVFAPRPSSMAVASNMRAYISRGDATISVGELYASYCCVEELLPASGVVPSLRTSTVTVTLTLSVTLTQTGSLIPRVLLLEPLSIPADGERDIRDLRAAHLRLLNSGERTVLVSSRVRRWRSCWARTRV